MKKVMIIFVIITGLFLTGCSSLEIESTTTGNMEFLNHQEITYDYTENVLSDGNSVAVKNVLYVPEADLLCLDLEFNNHREHYIYNAVFSYKDGSNMGSHNYMGIDYLYEDTYGYYCFSNVEYSSYTITIDRNLNNKEINLATITYIDENYEANSNYNFRIDNREENTIPFLEDPYIRFDVISDKDPLLIEGELYARLYDGREVYIEQGINKDDFIFNGEYWVNEDVTIEGLAQNYRFMTILAYKPYGDDGMMFDMDERYVENNITSARLENINSTCGLAYLCAKVYDTRVEGDNVVFDIYYHNDSNVINVNTNESPKIYFQVYDSNHNETFVQEVTTNQVIVPLELLMGDHRVELISDIKEYHEDNDGTVYEYYLNLDVRYVVDGELLGD